ncbi:MAG: glycosyltransferase [Candidatus Nanopelagicales bacterium]
MTRILAYTSPARGHLFPLVPILDELAQRGHGIAVRTLASEVPLMHSRGFAAEPISAGVEAIHLEDWRAASTQKALAASVATFVQRAPFDARDFERALRDEQPDVALIDINSWGALTAAERWGGAWAAFSPYPLALRSRDVPPFGPGLAPAAGPLGRLRDALLRPVVLGVIERKMLPPLNDVRKSMDRDPLRHFDELFRGAPLVLSMTAEPFEYHRDDWPDSVVMVGPCDWDPPAELPDWVQGLDGPLVLITTSSEFQDDGRLVEVAIQALADSPYNVVATVPSAQLRGPIPANVHVANFVPHGALLDRAVCAVTHGGMGATQKALAHGVPVCAVPFGRDQPEVARRVAVAGAGTRLPARRLTPQRLRSKIDDAIGMAPGARRVADGFRAAGGPSAAATAVEQRLMSVAL